MLKYSARSTSTSRSVACKVLAVAVALALTVGALPAPLAHLREHDAMTVRITLRGDRVVAALDGVEVIAAPVTGRPRRGSISIRLVPDHGGVRSRLWLADARIEP